MKAPEHLSPAIRTWWCEVNEEYDLVMPHHQKLLLLAAESLCRIEEAREILEDDGLVMLDRFGQKKSHPMLQVERDNKIAFARLIRELGLDLEASDDSRPPRRY